MSVLTLTLKSAPAQRIDCSPLTVDKLEGATLADIAAIELQSGRQKVRVDALFDIQGEPGGALHVANACDKLDHIGHAMRTGRITVDGDAGAYLGQFMQGGEIIVNGTTGIYTACEMQGGLIRVNGDAGDFVGGARVGYKNGMNGGTVIISGNSGDRTGDHMRRGTILIEGNAGDYCGARMVAGTIAVLGSVGSHVGYAMKRGTLLLFRQPEQGFGANFNDCGAHTLGFLPLMFASFRQFDSAFSRIEPFSRVRRFAGDISGIGMGEILVRI